MLKDGKIWMAKAGDKDLYLLPKMANRHGIIAGATGTGKTITLKVMAESFSDMGVPVFFSDVKGDLSGMCVPGTDSEDMQSRIANFGIEGWEYKTYPTTFWDLFGEKGHPVRVTMSGLGPMLLARLLNLNETQEGVLNIVFKVADDQGLLLLDMKDLRAMLQYVGDNKEEYTTMYGNVSPASVGAIQRALLAFEQEGGCDVFGEPELDVRDWIRTDINGRGMINILSSEKLFRSPKTYGTFLLWMLTELYENLPEVGDLDKPRMVFFFDEAHVLFDDTPKALHQKIAQVIKLIRSKGIGVFFVTQNPSDVPDDVLAQLSNRVQHGLRAYTPSEQKGIKAASESFRVNPEFRTEEALQALGTGEALVSFLEEDGVPAVVEKAKILPPQSLMGAAPEDTVLGIVNAGEFDLKYRQSVDRESAYEVIMQASNILAQQGGGIAGGLAAAGAAVVGGLAAAGEAVVDAFTPDQPAQAEAPAAEAEVPAAEPEMTMTEKMQAEIAELKKQNAELTEKVENGGKTEEEAAAEAEAEAKAEEKAEKKAAAKSAVVNTGIKAAKSAATNASSSVMRSLSTNIVNSITGSGKVSSVGQIGKRAATTALSSVLRTGSSSLIRGLFGNLTKK